MNYKSIVVGGVALCLLGGAGCNIVTVRTPSSTSRLPSAQAVPTVAKNPVISPQQTVPVVEQYLVDHLLKPTSGGRLFASFYIYAQEERSDELYYYIWAVVREYKKRGTTIERAGGASIPLNVVLTKDSDGFYNRVLGYRQARSELSTSAIKELFPAQAANQILTAPGDHARLVDLLEREVLAKAQNYFVQGEQVSIPGIEKQKCTNFKFDDYLDLTPFIGTPGPLRVPPYLRNNQKAFQAITNGYSSGFSFAGHYSLARWTCGVNCYDYVVIDTLGGTVVGAPFRARYGVDFHPESRMLIVNPYRNILAPDVKVTTSYLLLKDGPNPSLLPLCLYTPPNTPYDPALSGTDAGASKLQRYLSTDPSQCAAMFAQCNVGEIFFTDASGCGCESSSK
jgi:hypothetical protein